MATDITGIWSAVRNTDGVTVYVSGQAIVDGPVRLVGGATLRIMSGATASGVTNSGNTPTISVTSGGTLLSATVINGYVSALGGATTAENTLISVPVTYYSGAESHGDLFFASGLGADTATFNSGAVVIDATTSSGGPMVFNAGATVSGVTVSAGGSVRFNSGSVISGLIVEPGGSAVVNTVYGNPVLSGPELPVDNVTVLTGTWSAVLSGDRTVYVNNANTSTVNAPIRMSGGTLIVTSGAVASGVLGLGGYPTVSVLSGGTLAESQINNGYVYVNGGGVTTGNAFNSNPIVYSAGASSIGDMFFNSGYGADSVSVRDGATLIDPQIQNGAPVTISSGATVVNPVVTSGGSLTIAGGSAKACFLAGAMIETPDGECPVEALEIGQLVMVYRDGVARPEPVTRLLKARAEVDSAFEDDRAGYPVLVSAHSFGPSVPCTDLLVTAEHCFLLEGAFIPVRMLVNGLNIRYLRDRTHYDYYHVELARHGIIRANNALTESYLDTVTALRRDEMARLEDEAAGTGVAVHRSWPVHGAAPLRIGRDFVKPVHDAIRARYRKRDIRPGLSVPSEAPEVETDPDLHLVTEDGTRLDIRRRTEHERIFEIPEGTRRVYLASRTMRPCDVEGPFLDDRRHLGVLVGRMTLFAARGTHPVNTHLEGGDLEGWEALDCGTMRWTTGHATLALGPYAETGPGLLAIEILAAGPYPARATA